MGYAAATTSFLHGAIAKTTDGGITWSVQIDNNSRQLLSIDFFNDSVGVIVGTFGAIFRTINAGES